MQNKHAHAILIMLVVCHLQWAHSSNKHITMDHNIRNHHPRFQPQPQPQPRRSTWVANIVIVLTVAFLLGHIDIGEDLLDLICNLWTVSSTPIVALVLFTALWHDMTVWAAAEWAADWFGLWFV
jgi:hypothetical protein